MELLLGNSRLCVLPRSFIHIKRHRTSLWILFPRVCTPACSEFSSPRCHFHSLSFRKDADRPLLTDTNGFHLYQIPSYASKRGMSMLVVKFLRGALKIRYLLLGGAIGGGYSLQQTYSEWMNALPDLSWMDKYIPKTEDWSSIRVSLLSLKERLKEIEIDPRLRELADEKFSKMRDWLDVKLEEAKIAASEHEYDDDDIDDNNNEKHVSNTVNNAISLKALSLGKSEPKPTKNEYKKSHATEDDLFEIEMKYQKELERLERENKELRQQVLIRNPSSQLGKKLKVSLIDMYSDVLDQLTDYDANYKIQDHLPRVVVIGDQSSGKTSVLEMIAQARIFPRGAGEMMTRTPVTVTLSEGPYHIAQFKGSAIEYDLTKESDLEQLRKEVERKMRNLTQTKTVSNDVISMTVKGPGLQRMVLVDLPGIISTNTLTLASETKEAIRGIAEYYMSNPNAIILCIQDGSVDAERSNVTDLVSKMDPNGKRTILVLTKVDLAEQNHANPQRIQKILAGELFPMKALGYFAVVTGRGAKNESIEDIKRYEEEFFRNSKIFGGKVLRSTILTTRNLSLAVSECFWKMVRETVEQQADVFKAQRFNLETEWKNSFPRLRILSRNELFEKAKTEILDEVIKLSEINVRQWEETVTSTLWSKLSDFVFENIFFDAAKLSVEGDFNTQVEIQLYQWADQNLPSISVEAGWESLQMEFKKFMDSNKSSKDHDNVFDDLKNAVTNEVVRRHKWEEKALDVLRVLQVNTLEDHTIPDKQQWDSAVRFFESTLKSKLQEIEKQMREMLGPSWKERWFQWKYTKEEQQQRKTVKNELEKILLVDPDHPAILSEDELTTVRKTLERLNVSCDNEFITSTWSPLFMKYFLKRYLDKIPVYMRGYYLYKQKIDVQEYKEIVLYWRIQQTVRVTTNSLRQQIMNREALRIVKEIECILDEFGRDKEKKETLLTGRRVTLAEELKRVEQIQEKLEEFIKALNQEKQETRRLR